MSPQGLSSQQTTSTHVRKPGEHDDKDCTDHLGVFAQGYGGLKGLFLPLANWNGGGVEGICENCLAI